MINTKILANLVEEMLLRLDKAEKNKKTKKEILALNEKFKKELEK